MYTYVHKITFMTRSKHTNNKQINAKSQLYPNFHCKINVSFLRHVYHQLPPKYIELVHNTPPNNYLISFSQAQPSQALLIHYNDT